MCLGTPLRYNNYNNQAWILRCGFSSQLHSLDHCLSFCAFTVGHCIACRRLRVSDYNFGILKLFFDMIIIIVISASFMQSGTSWLWSYDSWIYYYLCYQCLSPLKLWVQTPLSRGVLDTTLCDLVCQWLAAGRWFYPRPLVSSTNKTDHHDITEILLNVALNTN